MTAILKLIPVESIIIFLLRRLQGISSADWEAAVRAVIAASKAFITSEEKLEFVKTALAGSGLAQKAMNWLIETALQYAIAKGEVKP